MKLSDAEAAVLCAIRLDADATVTELARVLKLKSGTVRNALTSLRERGIVRRFAMINITTLGYVEYDITCGLALRGSQAREAFFATLCSSPMVSQVLETGGSFQCVFTVCARTPLEVDQFLQELGMKFGPIFINLSIGACIRYANFPPKYLAPHVKPRRDAVVVSTSPSQGEPDATDHRILKALSRNREASGREIARLLGLPIATIAYRLKALEKRGTIVGYLNQIESTLAGQQSFLLYLSLLSVTPALRGEIFEFARAHPNVTYILEWLGHWHCGLGIVAPNASVASEISNLIYDRFGPALSELALFPALKDRKMSFYPF